MPMFAGALSIAGISKVSSVEPPSHNLGTDHGARPQTFPLLFAKSTYKLHFIKSK